MNPHPRAEQWQIDGGLESCLNTIAGAVPGRELVVFRQQVDHALEFAAADEELIGRFREAGERKGLDLIDLDAEIAEALDTAEEKARTSRITGAQVRNGHALADEYDAAQERGEISKQGVHVLNGNMKAKPAETAPPAIKATAYQWRDPADITRREWLYAKHYIRGYLTSTIGRAGLGKTERALAEALAMTTGRDLLDQAPPTELLRVWYIGEDPFEEIERRVAAACAHHQITAEQIGGRLFLNSTLDMPSLRIAEQGPKGGIAINTAVVDALELQIRTHAIDVTMLDPLIKFHGVPESDTTAMETVARALSELADCTRSVIEALHHTRKQGPGMAGAAATVDDGRGSSTVVGATRSARVLNPMSTAEADKAGIAEGDRWRYVRMDKPKANMAPPEAAVWTQHASLVLPCGESVGVCAPWKFPDAFASVTSNDVSAVRLLARTGAYRSDTRAANWFGKAVADHFGLDVDNKGDRAKVTGMLKVWFKNKVLDLETRDDEQRRPREYVIPGPWNDREPTPSITDDIA